jgi:hypothetical protein
VPLISGQTQSAGRACAAVVLNYARRPDGVAFVPELTRAYADADRVSLVRSFDWSVDPDTRSATLRLTDTFRFAAPPAALDECFISLRLSILEADSVAWSGEHGTITMQFARDQFQPTIEPITTQVHLGEPVTVYRLRLRALEATVNREAAFVFACRLLL